MLSLRIYGESKNKIRVPRQTAELCACIRVQDLQAGVKASKNFAAVWREAYRGPVRTPWELTHLNLLLNIPQPQLVIIPN